MNLAGNKYILIYGCRTARWETGEQFVKNLQKMTGADIAASDDITGTLNIGEDWRLEVTAGKVETPIPFIETAL